MTNSACINVNLDPTYRGCVPPQQCVSSHGRIFPLLSLMRLALTSCILRDDIENAWCWYHFPETFPQRKQEQYMCNVGLHHSTEFRSHCSYPVQIWDKIIKHVHLHRLMPLIMSHSSFPRFVCSNPTMYK